MSRYWGYVGSVCAIPAGYGQIPEDKFAQSAKNL